MKLSKKYIIGYIFCFSVVLITYFGLSFYIVLNSERDTKIKSDTILVLGARSYIDKKYNPCLVARVSHAVDLYEAKYAPKIIMSGGFDKEDKVSEAETMKKIALEKGVPSKDIILEKAATSTYQNFTYSKQILNKNNLKSIIIVTEPFHMARASLVAKNLSYNFTQSPIKDSPCWFPNKYFSKYFLKEPIAIILYKLQGKL